MRDAIIIFVAIILSMLIGAYLFFNGAPTFDPGNAPAPSSPSASFAVLAEGMDSGAVDRRTNYRIMSDDELTALWSLVYGTNGPAVPVVDFTRDEVIAVFDGSHSSGGYRIAVTDVTDIEGIRTVHIDHVVPADDCTVTEAITSPFEIIRVSKTTLPLAKQEGTVTNECR